MSQISPRSDIDQSDEDEVMYVITRTGRKEPLNPNQITKRLQTLINRKPKIPHINAYELMLEVSKGLKSGISTYDIDEYAANASASLSISNPYYLQVAARIVIDNHQKNTIRSFVDKMRKAYLNKDENNNTNSLINSEFFKYVEEHQDFIESAIDYNRDFALDFFGFQTFRRSYSIKINGLPIERPQDMFMRTAIDLHMNTCETPEEELDNIKHTYNLLSGKFYTHASPTYYNAGGLRRQYASCFLMGTADSRKGIMKTADDISEISKWAGGIGVHINNLRSTGSTIRSTNGKSSGIVPWLKIYNEVLKGFNQGGRRPGSGAFYLMPHHPDIMKFIELGRNSGADEVRARDLFYALWIPDIFMERVKRNEIWSLFDPDKCGDLSNYTGEEYRAKYLELESKKMYSSQIQARKIWEAAYETNTDVGKLYICFADNANRQYMQKNLGVLKSSNLCVSGDTLVLVEQGYYPIRELAETNHGDHLVWNGIEFRPAKFAKTGENVKFLQVKFSDGVVLKCTPQHKFTCLEFNSMLKTITKTAAELKPSDVLLNCEMPIIEKSNMIYADDEVPINASKETRIKWLTDLLNINGITYVWKNMYRLSLEGELPKLMQIKLLCNTLGVNPHINNNLKFSHYDVCKLHKIGVCLANKLYTRDFRKVRMHVHVKSVEPVETCEDSYCFNEPSRNMGIFNGVLTNNCAEIFLHSNDQEYAVCILSSIALPNYVLDGYSKEELDQPEQERRVLNHEFPVNPYFDFKKLIEVVRTITTNLNLIVDKTYHPLEETKRGNDRNRPIGIGVQGLDDCYAKMRMPFASQEARKLNKNIFETIYFAAMTQSSVLARKLYTDLVKKCKEGTVQVITHHPNKYETTLEMYEKPEDIPKDIGAYPSMKWNGGSPISHGIFHWELANLKESDLSGMFDWESLRSHIKTFGVRNSLTVACMPTASTSQLLGNNECVEPYTSNIYKRSTIAGEYVVVKKYLINDLYNLGVWNANLKDYLLLNGGSIQQIEGVPSQLKELYPTVWEIDQGVLIQQAIDRQPFVDQGQSLNLYVARLNMSTWNKLMFQAWEGGLKTGKYYLHSRAAVTPQNFTIDPSKVEEMKKLIEKNKHGQVLLEPIRDVCEVCSG